MPGERSRLLQLAMANHGSHLFGAAGMTSSVHTEEDIERTIDGWRDSLRELRSEGALE